MSEQVTEVVITQEPPEPPPETVVIIDTPSTSDSPVEGVVVETELDHEHRITVLETQVGDLQVRVSDAAYQAVVAEEVAEEALIVAVETAEPSEVEVVEEVVVEPDEPPSKPHWWFRQLWGNNS